MDNIRRFLAHAVRLEAEAARRFDELADHLDTLGNAEVSALFRQFADFSRLHLKEAMARGDFATSANCPPMATTGRMASRRKRRPGGAWMP